jgi:TctA family transporter
MLEAALSAAQQLFSTGPLLGMLFMLPIALISGLMPGGGLPVTVVILGFVGILDPWVAVTMVAFHMAASDITEPVPAIMMGIPGSRSAQATILDGYPMARQGLAGVALGASYTTTLVGGVFGALALLMSLPLARELMKHMAASEFFLLALLGLMAVAIVSSGAIVKGLLSAGLGLAVAMTGYSLIGGVVRTDFGLEYLWDGIPLIPVVIGLFALPEAIDLVVGNTPIATKRVEEMLKDAQKDVFRGMRIAFQHKWLMIKSSLIGTFIGALPGLGASTGHWIAYAYAKQTEPGAKETFGKGDVRGVIASDAANNSSDGGVLIPTVAFGIPGSGGMAILMTMLILYGISPGLPMLNEHLDLTISLVYTIAFANIVAVPVMLYFSSSITKVAAIPPNLLAPTVIGVVTIGAFQASASMGDLAVMLVFGVLGIFMKRYGWPRPPILIALVLGDIVEKYLWISTNTWGWSMFQRPQFLVIAVLMVLLVVGSLRIRRGTDQVMQSAASGTLKDDEPIAADQDGAADKTTAATDFLRKAVSLEILGEITLLTLVTAFFGYALADSIGWTGEDPWPLGAALAPWIALAISLPFLVIRIVHVVRAGLSVQSVEISAGEIMDVGFRIGEDPKAEAQRFARIVIAIGILNLAIWLIGFHIAVPLWVFCYMYWFGNARFIWSAFMALLFVGLLVGVYDYLINVPWHRPILLELFGYYS